MANISMCQCPCHIEVWMGVNPPVCNCRCRQPEKYEATQAHQIFNIHYDSKFSNIEVRLRELEEWTRKDEDRIYERLEKLEKVSADGYQCAKDIIFDGARTNERLATLERHLQYQLVENRESAKHIEQLEKTLNELITKIADLGNFYYREKEQNAKDNKEENRNT